ncbi:MAG: hypothetical protein ABSG46_20205 [Candidatus Binataceae bacterium]
MPGVSNAWADTIVPSTVVSASGATAALEAPYGSSTFSVLVNVTAYTSGTLTFEVQWSFDGVNFYSADPKDTFVNITALTNGLGQVIKTVTCKAPYYRLTWTTGAYTFTAQAMPSGYAASGTPDGFVLGASSAVGGVPVFGAVASTTLAAVFAQATTTTYSAITAVPTVPSEQAPMPVSRLAIMLNVTADTFTTPVFEIYWSLTGLPYNVSTNPLPFFGGDPVDSYVTSAAGAYVAIKEVAVKAPYYVIAIVSGTPGSATFTANHCVTAL